MSTFGAAGMAAYTAAKHGVLGLTRALGSELGPHGITVNCIQPGAILTGMTEPMFKDMPESKIFWENKAALKRLGKPEDIANVVAFIASDDAGFVTGHGIFVDGGAMQQF
jgi:NAD(P)-dependent dehydrogenase (short-subunit alcohol dehydrogenase family)